MNPVFTRKITATEADIDELGHVNNAVWVQWIQEVALAHWYSVAAPEHQGDYIWVVVRHEIDYKRPLIYHPRGVDIELWVGAIKAASFEIRYEVHDEDTVFATASSVLVPYDLVAERPRRVSPRERAFLEQFVEVA